MDLMLSYLKAKYSQLKTEDKRPTKKGASRGAFFQTQEFSSEANPWSVGILLNAQT